MNFTYGSNNRYLTNVDWNHSGRPGTFRLMDREAYWTVIKSINQTLFFSLKPLNSILTITIPNMARDEDYCIDFGYSLLCNNSNCMIGVGVDQMETLWTNQDHGSAKLCSRYLTPSKDVKNIKIVSAYSGGLSEFISIQELNSNVETVNDKVQSDYVPNAETNAKINIDQYWPLKWPSTAWTTIGTEFEFQSNNFG